MASYRIRRNKVEKIVILDSSAILMLFEFSINLEDELTRLLGKCRIVVPKSIVEELKFLSKNGKGRKKTFAKVSFELIEKYDVVDTDGFKGDDSVLFLAKELNGIVVTNDRELRERTKEAGLHTIFLRNKSKLVLD